MTRYRLQPEVAGGWGDATIADTSVHPPLMRTLEYRFEGWLGDEILESFPCFIVTSRVAEALRASSLTGFAILQMSVSRSSEFDECSPAVTLPTFEWLDILGGASVDDFALDSEHRLVVSERAMDVLRCFEISHCSVEASDA